MNEYINFNRKRKVLSKSALKKLKEIFVDEMVTFYLRDLNVVSVNEENQEVKISAMSDGYVIDVDSNYYYVGLTDGTITRTIPHDTIAMTELTFAGGQLIDEDMPTNDDEVH